MTAYSMSVKEACRYIGIGKTKLYQLINDGSIPVTRIGRRTLVRTDSLVTLVTGVEL